MGACGSLCDNCRQPGRCCTGFVLEGGKFGLDKDDAGVRQELATRHQPFVGGATGPLPFEPLFRSTSGVWSFWCPRLGRDGRCTDYHHRPQLCADYQPGSDGLCIMRPKQEESPDARGKVEP